MIRPENHVTRAMQGRTTGKTIPAVTFSGATAELLANLKEQFPPRCKLRGESEEEHQRYAGKVELIAQLSESYDAQKEHAVDPEELEGDLLADAERAT